MKHMRKGIALLLAAMMVMPNMPASAENVQSETQVEEGKTAEKYKRRKNRK